MTYDEFERRVLKIVFEEQKDSLTPSYLAYKLQIPHNVVKQHLDHALENGIVELTADDDGKIAYLVPGFDPNAKIVDHKARSLPYRQASHSKYQDENPPNIASYEDESFEEAARREVDELTPHTEPIASSHKDNSLLPAIVDDASQIEPYESRLAIYIRKIRIKGNYREAELHDRLAVMLEALGYEPVAQPEEPLSANQKLYKRGSFIFILAMLPLFLLVIPLIIYLINQMVGNSGIRNEPIFLEVETSKLPTSPPMWEITLTYRGRHGIVFAKGDRKVLDLEVDMLSKEFDNLWRNHSF